MDLFGLRVKGQRKYMICLLIYAATTYALVMDKLTNDLIFQLYLFVGGFYVSANVLSKLIGGKK